MCRLQKVTCHHLQCTRKIQAVLVPHQNILWTSLCLFQHMLSLRNLRRMGSSLSPGQVLTQTLPIAHPAEDGLQRMDLALSLCSSLLVRENKGSVSKAYCAPKVCFNTLDGSCVLLLGCSGVSCHTAMGALLVCRWDR